MKNILNVNLVFTIALLFSLLFTSCEYDSGDDNYHEVEKPKPTLEVKIDIAGVDPSKVIQVPNNSILYYTMSAEGKKCLQQEYYWDGKLIGGSLNDGIKNNEFGVYIHQDVVDDQIHELTIKTVFKSGSGSLADHLNLEYYLGEMTYQIKLLENTNHETSFDIRQTSDEEGYLKLEWDRPEGLDIIGYEIIDNTTQPISLGVVDATTQSFVDKEYIYGYKLYYIYAILRNGTEASKYQYYGRHINKYTHITKDNITIKAVDNNKIAVNFENPNTIPVDYIVYDSKLNKKELVSYETNQYLYERISFPDDWRRLELQIIPKGAGINSAIKIDIPTIYSRDASLPSSFGKYYKTNEPKYYTIDFNTMSKYDADKDFKLIKESKIIPSPQSTGSQIKVAPNGTVAISSISEFGFADNIVVYTNDDLNTAITTINNVSNFSLGGNYVLTDARLYNGDGSYEINVYDIVSKKNLFALTLSQGETAYISPNGQYFIVKNNRGLDTDLYEIVNSQPILKYSWRNMPLTQNPVFNPANESEILFVLNNKIVIIDLNTSTTKASIEGHFIALDPITGKVLYHKGEEEKMSIMDKDYSTVLASDLNVKLDVFSEPHLYNNLLIIRSNYSAATHYCNYRNLITK